MNLRKKLLTLSGLLHSFLLVLSIIFYQQLELYILLVELVLLGSFVMFYRLIARALQPLEYIDIFSNLLKEEEFTSRFSQLHQKDLDRLVDQFNVMLNRLHKERLAIGEQKGVFQKLMAESPIGVVLMDYDNRISDLNPAAEKLLGINKDVAFEKNLSQFDQSLLKQLKDVTVDTHQLVLADRGRRLKIGHYAIHDRGFDRSFYMLFEMTSEIHQSQKVAYEKLIRLMSHEVNNTIAITNSLLESCLTFKSQLDDDSKQDFVKAINIVVNRCGSLNEFMQGYSDIVKLSQPVLTEFNFSKLIRDLSFLFHAECKKQNIELSFIHSGDIYLNADVSLIEQAIMNVIKNAMEAIESSGRIEISLQKSVEKIVLEIRDNGCGISEEIEQQLFTPFFTSKESGQGVGLMLVREIFKLHDFDFSLRNRIETNGALFQLVVKI
ncbi:MAG: PAS domain-containing protein [Kangiellaceae bacterium]|nr:PAS domain-containing protein [Kangiellaceae bacterium]